MVAVELSSRRLQDPTPELLRRTPPIPTKLANLRTAMPLDPNKPISRRTPPSPLHPTADCNPVMTRSGSFSSSSKPGSSFIIKQLEALSLATTQVDDKKKEKQALTALTKCRSLNGGAGEVEEKRVAPEVGRGRRRRSFGAPDVDVGCVFAGAGARVVAKDMPPFMMVHAVTFARRVYDGMEKFSSKTLALSLKKEFDVVYGPAWHCIVGTSFGSFVTHSVGGFLYFSLDKLHILLFKTTVQRADH